MPIVTFEIDQGRLDKIDEHRGLVARSIILRQMVDDWLKKQEPSKK